jgi:catechol 2,3-dioxygenase-like lactoylglutathione lyase family enzyme
LPKSDARVIGCGQAEGNAAMPTQVRPIRVNHMNMVVEDFERSVTHFRELYGAEFVADLPQREWHAGLVAFGGVLIEIFAPHSFLLNMRYGPFDLGLEYQADMEAVRAAVAERGIRIARDIGSALHTHPADTLGVSFEFYAGDFPDREWPLLGGPMTPPAYWRDEHPLGLAGQKGYTHAVDDLPGAVAFLQDFLSAEIAYETDRPAIGARAVGLKIADVVVELQAAAGEGALAAHLRRYGPGIRSTVFRARDLDQARRYFEDRGVSLAPGDTAESFSLPPEANLGLRFEFAE